MHVAVRLLVCAAFVFLLRQHVRLARALAALAVDPHVAWRGRDYALDGGAHLRS